MIYWTEYAERGTWDTADTNWNQQFWQLWVMEIWELTYEYFWCAEMICEGMSVISFSSVLKCCLFPPKAGGKVELCPVVHVQKRDIVFFLPLFLPSCVSHCSLLSVSPSHSASCPFISTSIPTISISPFCRFLLTHLPPVNRANSSAAAKIVSENTLVI